MDGNSYPSRTQELKDQLRAELLSELKTDMQRMAANLHSQIMERVTKDMKKMASDLKSQVRTQMIEEQDRITKENEKIIRDLRSQLIEENRQEQIRMSKDLKAKISDEVKKESSAAAAATGDARSSALIVNSERQLAAIKAATTAMVVAAEKRITDTVTERVFSTFNAEVVPELNKAVSWMYYNTEDGQLTVDAYRRAVEAECNRGDGKRLITDGNDKHIISPFVRTFFKEGD